MTRIYLHGSVYGVLFQGWESEKWKLCPRDALIENEPFEAYVLRGFPASWMVSFIRTAKKRGKKLAWDYDEDWFSLPPSHPLKPFLTSEAEQDLLQSLNLVDLIICSNEQLAWRFRGNKTRVCPPCFPGSLDYLLRHHAILSATMNQRANQFDWKSESVEQWRRVFDELSTK